MDSNLNRSRLTYPQQVNAIVDVVMGGNPFTRDEIVDADGNITFRYTPKPIVSSQIPCATQVSGLLSYVMNFLNGSIFTDLKMYVPGEYYVKNSIVRYGTTDYQALVGTSSTPGASSDWAVIRQNSLGPVGPAGQGTSTVA